MIARLLGAVTGADWAVKAALAAAVVASAGAALAMLHHTGVTKGRGEVQAAWNADKLARSTAALETIKGFVAERTAQQQEIARANQDLRQFEAVHARYVAAAAADLERVRGDIATFSGGGDSAADSVTACRGRADALGGLLGEALRASGECAAAGELDAATARAVLKAWPTSQ